MLVCVTVQLFPHTTTEEAGGQFSAAAGEALQSPVAAGEALQSPVAADNNRYSSPAIP